MPQPAWALVFEPAQAQSVSAFGFLLAVALSAAKELWCFSWQAEDAEAVGAAEAVVAVAAAEAVVAVTAAEAVGAAEPGARSIYFQRN